MTRNPLLAILFVALLSSALPAGEFPYSARISNATAAMRSGPGTQFYATGQLLQDEEVEVYRHVGTWCAIRPTPSSFSYVRADHVRVTEVPDVLEISVEGARTRVGSEINDEFKVQYVTLHRGERVRMVGDSVTFGRPPRRWYKIAPPSGEFRWIARADLARVENSDAGSTGVPSSSTDAASDEILAPVPADELPVDDPEMARVPTPASLPVQNDVTNSQPSVARRGAAASMPEAMQPTPAEPLSEAATDMASAEATADNDSVDDASSDDSIKLQKLAARAKGMSTEPIPHQVITVSAEEPLDEETHRSAQNDASVSTGDPAIDNLPSIMVRRSRAIQPVAASDEAGRVAPAVGSESDAAESVNSAWTAVDTELPPPPSPQQLDHSLGELASLELELSRIVTQDIGQWQFTDLQTRLVELRRATGDPQTRRSIEHLWKRTQEFAELQQRHRELLTGGPSAIQASNAAPLLPERPPVSRDVELAGASLAASRRMPAMANRVPASRSSLRAGGAGDGAGAPATMARDGQQATAYAGQGWLVPVLTSRTDLPRFALTDAQGQILHFVTPVNGLNLRRYLRQQVGIVGSSRAGRTGEPGPLLAERVVVLERR